MYNLIFINIEVYVKKILLSIVFLLTISCSNFKKLSIYQLEINQGNEISKETIEYIKIGDNKEKVINLLGTPLIKDPFHNERWDYQYYFQNKDKKENKIFTIYFKNDKVVEIQGI